MAALLLSRAFAGTALDAPEPEHHHNAMVIAEIVEIMHTSSGIYVYSGILIYFMYTSICIYMYTYMFLVAYLYMYIYMYIHICV